MVSFTSLASSSASTSTSTTTTTKRKPVKTKKQPAYRPTGRGGAGNLKRSKSSSPTVRYAVSTLSMAGREIPLPGSGVSYTGRGGAGNAANHYLEPHVFKRVLAHEMDIVHSLQSPEDVVKSGRGGIGNITSHRKDKRVSTMTGTSSSIVPSVAESDDVSMIGSNSSSASFISGFDNNPYMRKRSMSVSSTVSASSAYTGMQHEQSPTSSTVATTSSQIPSNYLLGRRLRPTPSIESTSSDEQSTATHDLFYLATASALPTPRPMSAQAHRPPAPQTIAPHLRMQRGGSSPGTVRPPSGMYIPLQTLSGLRPPSTLSEEPDAGNRESVLSARLSLSDFPLPPPSPADFSFAPPQSAPSTQTSFVFMSTSPPRRSLDLPQKPPPSGPLPVPPRRPPPSGPLPPIPSSPVTAQPPMSPTRGAFPSQDDTIRAPRPVTRPSLVGKLPPPAPLLSAPVSSTTPASTPGVRPPPSPSGYFRRRPSTAPISGPVPGSAFSPGTSLSASSSTSSFSGTENSPMSPSGSSISFRSSDSGKGVYTPAAAPEKTAALVRALSLDTTSADSVRSSLDMNDSGSSAGSTGGGGASSIPQQQQQQQQPRSFFDDPLVDEPARTSRSSRSSKTPYSPPQSPAPSRTSMDGKKRASAKGSDVDMRTKLALLAMRRDHKAANAVLFPRGAMGANSLRL